MVDSSPVIVLTAWDPRYYNLKKMNGIHEKSYGNCDQLIKLALFSILQFDISISVALSRHFPFPTENSMPLEISG